MAHPRNYGYPSYIDNWFQASCYDGMKFTRELWAGTAARNAAHEKNMAESWAAKHPVFFDAPAPPRFDFLSGVTQEPWRNDREFPVGGNTRRPESFEKSSIEAQAARRAEEARVRETLEKAMAEGLAKRQAEEARWRETFEKAMAESLAKRQAEEVRRREEFQKLLAVSEAVRKMRILKNLEQPAADVPYTSLRRRSRSSWVVLAIALAGAALLQILWTVC